MIPKLYKIAKRQWLNNNDDSDIQYKQHRDRIQSSIKQQLLNQYSKQLAAAYKKATGKNLSDAAKYIKPQIGFVINSKANVDPSIIDKLNKQDKMPLQYQAFSYRNVPIKNYKSFIKMLKKQGNN